MIGVSGAELGTRDNCRVNVVMFQGQQIVACCLVAIHKSTYVATILILHCGLQVFQSTALTGNGANSAHQTTNFSLRALVLDQHLFFFFLNYKKILALYTVTKINTMPLSRCYVKITDTFLYNSF